MASAVRSPISRLYLRLRYCMTASSISLPATRTELPSGSLSCLPIVYETAMPPPATPCRLVPRSATFVLYRSTIRSSIDGFSPPSVSAAISSFAASRRAPVAAKHCASTSCAACESGARRTASCAASNASFARFNPSSTRAISTCGKALCGEIPSSRRNSPSASSNFPSAASASP